MHPVCVAVCCVNCRTEVEELKIEIQQLTTKYSKEMEELNQRYAAW